MRGANRRSFDAGVVDVVRDLLPGRVLQGDVGCGGAAELHVEAVESIFVLQYVAGGAAGAGMAR